MPSGIFIIWILYLPSSHGLPANNFQPALQIELLGSRTVGPGTAESTHSAWTRTAACSPPSSWPWSQSLLACGPPQPAEICSLTPASCNKLDLFSRIGSVSYSCILNAIVSCTAPVHQVHSPPAKTWTNKVAEWWHRPKCVQCCWWHSASLGFTLAQPKAD